ncbi:GNAT family N-acetyltransferase [Verrucosispora sioxanthis]|uniref:GNAT family N-acetyltransferase n=1 Tax=Verrucosispora sioxanthis TaxID=2499994 RepID=A0A6M1LD39_9ACTN|nr:GNAT family N-acetyltransferase [Verrucosispora sioxanthis]NEE66924.1 GNAT family N-acetyltransferase [Verrucosispora sioxanthis]NGM16034.1 GNAT family N-acetyltransferase [Verrucosispora sioxanthis]
MVVRAEHDRAVLAGLLSRDPVLHAYQLGDLDDFFWPYTSWFRRGESVVLLYHGAVPPTLLAFARPAQVGAVAALLGEVAPVLPARLYAHLSPGLESVLGGAFRVTAAGPHLKMALTDRGRLAAVTPAGEVLGRADLPRLHELYAAAYPGNWFDPRMVDTGRYVGIRDGGLLVAVAGVHVVSAAHRVAAVGNVTTRPGWRGRGLAGAVVARLCGLLAAEVDHVTLNVAAGNPVAVRLYERLGFTRVADYGEFTLVARNESRMAGSAAAGGVEAAGADLA